VQPSRDAAYAPLRCLLACLLARLLIWTVSLECDNLPKMDAMSKSDPIAVLSVQETVPAPKAADATLLGKMGLKTGRRSVSLAAVLAKTPEFRAANRA
jgi:hypothetical protein